MSNGVGEGLAERLGISPSELQLPGEEADEAKKEEAGGTEEGSKEGMAAS